MNLPKRSKFKKAALLAAVGVAVLAAMIIITIKLAPDFAEAASDADSFRELIQSYGVWGAFVFMGFQIIQIVISVIPGEPVQIAGGYVFGTWVGFGLLCAGTLAGSAISFVLGRAIGYPIVRLFAKPEHFEKFKKLVESPKSQAVIFLLFLMPGFPKESITYIASLSPVKPVRFLIVTFVARLPGLWGSAYIGSRLHHEDYTTVIIVFALAALLFVGALLYKKYMLPRHMEKTGEKTGEKRD